MWVLIGASADSRSLGMLSLIPKADMGVLALAGIWAGGVVEA